jgi:hypothetical protein
MKSGFEAAGTVDLKDVPFASSQLSTTVSGNSRRFDRHRGRNYELRET